ncbi:CGH_3_collapsed_G0034180.mRNA.1.CDS.1 [Saccharomyces cerevisiae]|nr:CGH_3_collapsed_G0034180.mRNA.1.CDS.1 [Saccharomyces cerevisiae]
MGGVDALGSTLVSVAGAGFAVVCAFIATLMLAKWKNISALTAIFWTLPALVGSIAAAALPWDNKIGILANICMAGQIFGIPFIIALSWASSSASGYTKKPQKFGVLICDGNC